MVIRKSEFVARSQFLCKNPLKIKLIYKKKNPEFETYKHDLKKNLNRHSPDHDICFFKSLITE